VPNRELDIHINRGTVAFIITALMALLGFNWDTRERVIRVEAQLETHMHMEPPPKITAAPNLLSMNAFAEAIPHDTTTTSRHHPSKK
jgi:hypothetical protein